MDYDVTLTNITKTYEKGQIKAVKNVSLQIEKGELFGLIGPDGAGKTSIFRILTTLLLPDEGSATINGLNVVTQYREIRKKVGYMPGKLSLYQDLSIEENLKFFATLFGTTIEENYDLIEEMYVKLEPFKNRPAGKLSGGMQQKLALCCAMIHRPTVLFLDEPTTGIDSISRKEFWHMLKKLKDQNITILVSTPYMDEASLCERIALIQEGEIMSVDTPEKIMDQYPVPLFKVKSDKMSQLLKDLRAITYVASAMSFGEFHHITFSSEKDQTPQLLLDLKHHKNLICQPTRATVEDCFIHLMQNRAHGE